MTSTFTGASVSRIDIEPVSIEALACASSVGLRPSQPTGASPAWPSPISGCDLRDVSLPESLRLFALGHAPAERREVAARARRRAGGGEPRLEEQRPAEPDEGGVLDRPRRRTPVLLPQRREVLRREGLRRNAGRRPDDAGNGEAERHRKPAS